ncbi:SpoIIE family protein phosphatase [Aliikangiella sp. G2MR2-5]|uniref:ATP-binding SpoIIE family protein phosphatase n=1 Tax=Aliikangiella sp. G2MR2-5 TaxID=2788943 RepID=UPI0018AB4ABA|nr:SpoIIE family protein phosphatase [Aliikangiella sp. G2MR2-5]
MKILIADDNKVERLILCKVLEQEGHEVVQAGTGQQAIDYFFEHSPALVFLDVLMPDKDGYEVASVIKESKQVRWVPIIFLTSLTDVYDLAKCIDCGGDDFVSKPINKVIIKAKVNAFSRISNLYETIEAQKSEIQFHNEHLIQEQEAAKKIFNNIAHRGCLAAENIHYHLSPMSIFNGDLMLAAEPPMGGMRLMLADFTGHGLPAAIGAMPTSEIFYGMTKKGFAIRDVMTEMNMRLHSVLPRGVFCCVVIADIDTLEERITIWNAGAPQAYLLDLEKGDIEMVQSCHLPLGVQSPQRFKVEPSVFRFTKHHKLLAVTDGIIESTNEQGDMYGEERMLAYIKDNLQKDNLCDALVEQIVEYTNDAEQGDDLSLLEVAFPHHHLLHPDAEDSSFHAQTGTLDSNIRLRLRGKSLGRFDPIPMLLQTLLECRELNSHRSRLFTIVSELYNNALEHGVLGLDSSIKSGSEGFAKYYQMRTEGVMGLTDGFVEVSIDHKPLKDGGELVFDFKDSGSGFNFEKVLEAGSKTYSGRGLPLLKSLCEKLEHFDEGRHIRATYRWRPHDEE